jgi:hypothetical protein
MMFQATLHLANPALLLFGSAVSPRLLVLSRRLSPISARDSQPKALLSRPSNKCSLPFSHYGISVYNAIPFTGCSLKESSFLIGRLRAKSDLI